MKSAALLSIVIAISIGRETRADLLVCSNYNGRILRYDGTTGAYLGPLAFVNCSNMTVGPDGELWVASPDTISPDAPYHMVRLDLHTGLQLSSVPIPTQV